MRIGQIVAIDDHNIPRVQTGIIIRREKEAQGQYWWYEVLANDEKKYVLPAFVLSPQLRQIRTSNEVIKTSEKTHNFQQHGTKHLNYELHYIHNGTQKLK